MPTEAYIDALLVDKVLADQIWGAWFFGAIDSGLAFLAWTLIAEYRPNDDPKDAI